MQQAKWNAQKKKQWSTKLTGDTYSAGKSQTSKDNTADDEPPTKRFKDMTPEENKIILQNKDGCKSRKKITAKTNGRQK